MEHSSTLSTNCAHCSVHFVLCTLFTYLMFTSIIRSTSQHCKAHCSVCTLHSVQCTLPLIWCFVLLYATLSNTFTLCTWPHIWCSLLRNGATCSAHWAHCSICTAHCMIEFHFGELLRSPIAQHSAQSIANTSLSFALQTLMHFIFCRTGPRWYL